MADIKFDDNSIEVKAAINDACIAWLYEVAEEFKSQTQDTSPVDTGQLKNSWDYKVDESERKAVVGSPLENAIWNEFGTGQYALNGNGRKTPWLYEDRHGKTHRTTGKKPQRTLHNAFESIKGKAQKALENKLKGLK